MTMRLVQLKVDHINDNGTVRVRTMHTSNTDATASDVVLGFDTTKVKTKSALRQVLKALSDHIDGDNSLTT